MNRVAASLSQLGLVDTVDTELIRLRCTGKYGQNVNLHEALYFLTANCNTCYKKDGIHPSKGRTETLYKINK